MTDISDLERDLEELFTLRAAAVRPCREPLTLTRQARPQHRRLWALAAAVFVVLGVVAGSLLLIDRDETVTTEPEPEPEPSAPTSVPMTDGPIPTTAAPPGDPFDQVLGFAPTEGIPEGWIVTHAGFAGVPASSWATRQLFGDAGAPQPMNRSVLIVSSANPYGPTHLPTTVAPSDVVRGAAASIEAYGDGTVHIQWASGEILHLATVRGMDETDAVAFIESLQARAEPLAGFDAAPGGLVEVASEASRPAGQSFYMALRPPGSPPDARGPKVDVFATSTPDLLEFRALGTPERDGTLVIRQDDANGRHSVGALRTDGWLVTVDVFDVDGLADPNAMIDAIRAGLQPVTGRELIDAGRALPVMEEADVDGQRVTVHGIDGFERVICLGTSDSANCGLAASVPGAVGAWILTDDGWVVVVRGGVLSEVSDPTATVPPPAPNVVPSDQWAIVDVRDDAWLVMISSKHGGAGVGRPLP